jgi:chromosome segregation ATPase
MSSPVHVSIGYSKLSSRIVELEAENAIVIKSNKEKDCKIELLKLAKKQVQEKFEDYKKNNTVIEKTETRDASIQTNENKLLKIVKLSQKNIPTFETRSRDIPALESIELPVEPKVNEFEEKYKELKKINYDTLGLYETLRVEAETSTKKIEELNKKIRELNEELSTSTTDLLKYRGDNAVLRRKLDSNTVYYPQVESGRYSGVSR